MNLLLAWRNIWRNKARSILIMTSIAIGLAAGIFVLSLYKGMLSGRVRTIIDYETGHIQIHQKGFLEDLDASLIIPNGDSIMNSISLLQEVKEAAGRTIVQGMLVSVSGSAGVKIHGVVPEVEYRVSGLREKIIEGDGFKKEKKNLIVIGKKLSQKMRLKLGSKIVLTFTDTTDNIVSSTFRIGGIYQSNNAPLDEINVYVDWKTLNELLGVDDAFHEIAVILKSDNGFSVAKDELQKKYSNLSVMGWNELSPETELMINTVNELSYIIIIIILIALAFGILNTMLMSVLERKHEIGMMIALGTSRVRVFFLIIYETLILTLAGAPVGFLGGYFIVNYLHHAGMSFAGEGQELMRSFGFNTTIYPEFPYENLTFIIVLVVIAALLSSILPAWKTLRLQPVEALRK